MHLQDKINIGMKEIGNVDKVLPYPLEVSDLNNLSSGDAKEIVNLYEREHSKMVAKEIEDLITKPSLKKIRINRKEYQWKDAAGPTSSGGPTMIYLLFKNINPTTSIGVSNLKEKIKKLTISNFGDNI